MKMIINYKNTPCAILETYKDINKKSLKVFKILFKNKALFVKKVGNNEFKIFNDSLYVEYIHPKSGFLGRMVLYGSVDGSCVFVHYFLNDWFHREDGFAYATTYCVRNKICKTKKEYEKELKKFLKKYKRK